MLAGVAGETLTGELKVTGRRHAVAPVRQLGITVVVLAGCGGRGGRPLIVQRHCGISLQIHDTTTHYSTRTLHSRTLTMSRIVTDDNTNQALADKTIMLRTDKLKTVKTFYVCV